MEAQQQNHNIFISAAAYRLSYIHGSGLHWSYIYLFADSNVQKLHGRNYKDILNLLVLHVGTQNRRMKKILLTGHACHHEEFQT